jgi:hypothetical protein
MLFATALPRTAEAHADPGGCESNGVGLSLTVYRNDETTVIGGGDTVESGETIKYQAKLSHVIDACNFEGGDLDIVTPDGENNDVDGGVIPLVSFGSPFASSFAPYVVSESDVAGGILIASAIYTGGESHTGTGHDPASASVGKNTSYQDIALEVSKDANPSLTETYEWSIDKTVTPAAWDLFDGDSGTSEYTIALTKRGPVQSGFAVEGTITIHNPAEFADAIITDVADAVSGVGAMTVECPETLPFNLAPGADLVCTYSGALPDDTNRTNTATVTTEGDVDGGEGEAAVDFTDAEIITENDEVNVDDTFDAGDAGPFNSSTEYSYEREFTCGADEGRHGNTATIVETDDSDDASVQVNCYELAVQKTAETSYDRTWEWVIDKSADQTDLLLAEGELFTVNYTVDVDASSVDGNHAVSGEITISNSHPTLSAELTNVADMIDGLINAVVNCPSSTVPAAGVLICTYSADLSGDEELNEAIATQQNYSYDAEGTPTPVGTTNYQGSAAISFGNPESEIDECADVSDTNVGFLGTVCADAAPTSFDYSVDFGTPEEADVILACGAGNHPNVADFITNDTAATGNDDWNVNWTVECILGCTLTQGYWKTHNESFWGGAPADDNWLNVGPDAEQTEFDAKGFSWFDAFWTPVKGSAWYQLAHQWMAAELNVLNGATAPANVQTALADGWDWLLANEPGAKLKGNAASDAKGWASTLGSFNEGLIGPGHCDEQNPEV